MNYRNIFDLVAMEFKKANIPFVLGGGFAINFYSVSRNTGDADFLVRDQEGTRAGEILERFGYKKFIENNLFARFESADLRFMPADLLFLDENTFLRIQKEGKIINILDHEFAIPSLDHLLAMKIHAMKSSPDRRFFKDMPDIVQLIQRNNLSVDSECVQDLFLKYGTKDLYDKVLSVVKGI